MQQISDEEVVMKLIVPSGKARSSALEAIGAARKRDFAKADELISQAQKELLEAHELQSEIIRLELNSECKQEMSLVMAHGQDHLMNATTILDLAIQMVEMIRENSLVSAQG